MEKNSMANAPDYIVYTDGGCARNPGGPGGIGVVIINGRTGEICEYAQGYQSTTNNRMEMRAVLTALRALPGKCSIILYSDSQYVINCMSGAWQKKKNTDIWNSIDMEAMGKRIDLRWVRGHKGNLYNERCDELATMSIRDSRNWSIDEGYEGEGKKVIENNEKDGEKKGGGAMAVRIVFPEGFADRAPIISDVNMYAAARGISNSCAEGIRNFYARSGSKSFKAYMRLKTGGIDSVSRTGREALTEMYPDGKIAKEIISGHIQDPRDALSAMRWHARGLTIEDSIRKALVDAEVRQNCAQW